MQKDKKGWKFFLLKKLPVYILLIIIGFISGMIVLFYFNQEKKEQHSEVQVAKMTDTNGRAFRLIRENNMALISPLLYTERTDESDRFSILKENVTRFIDKKKQEGVITSASVIVRTLNDGNWMAVNKNEMFSPGSIMKIPTLMTILKEAEMNPGILEKKIPFKKHFSHIPEQTITGALIMEGNSYTVKQLMYAMIVNSDNDATALLNQTLNFDVMKKLFSDLQMTVPDKKQPDYLIDVSDCSKFLTVLYNATYLNKEMSMYALGLLTKSAYKDGIIKDLDPSITVAHKFGERNNSGEQELHEFGIVYIDDSPYLLGVMTKGNNNKILPEVLSGVSDMIYQSLKPVAE
jgi:beta-lactamase class A